MEVTRRDRLIRRAVPLSSIHEKLSEDACQTRHTCLFSLLFFIITLISIGKMSILTKNRP